MTNNCLTAGALAALLAFSTAPAFAQNDRGVNAGGVNSSTQSSTDTTTSATTPRTSRTTARSSHRRRTAATRGGTHTDTAQGIGAANQGVPNQYVGQGNQGGPATVGQSTGTGTTTTRTNSASPGVGVPNQYNGQGGPAAAVPPQSGLAPK